MNSSIAGGYVDLKRTVSMQPIMNRLSGSESLESDVLFKMMDEYAKANPEQVKKINGIFLYHILVKGKPQATWSKYICLC